MPSAFRRIADEFDPSYVPDSARRGRRRVPSYTKVLLSLFGKWWVPRLGLSLVTAAALLEIAGIISSRPDHGWLGLSYSLPESAPHGLTSLAVDSKSGTRSLHRHADPVLLRAMGNDRPAVRPSHGREDICL